MIGLVAAVIGLVAAGVVGVVSWRAQHRTIRRIGEVSERLGDPVPANVPADVAIDHLERAVDRVRRRDDDIRIADVRIVLALDELTQGLAVCDANGVIVLRNEFARSFVDARHGEALVDAALHELLAAALRGRRGARELHLHGPPQRFLQVRAAPLVADNAHVGAIAVINDVTEQKRVESVRRDFVANVSHELKTPLGALALLAETLADEPDPAVVRRLSGRLRDESFRVSDIVDDLLTLSRIEGHESFEPVPVSIAALLSESVGRVRQIAEHRDVTIVAEDIEPTFEIVGDRTQLISALFNLLDNAVKYSESGSSVEVNLELTDDTVSLSVRDHGIGIPTSDLERIFERFYRVDKARSRDTGGTGLGLAIVRHVAQNHGGDVHVASREGEGSVFTLVLPRRGVL